MRDLRRALEELRHEKESTDAKAARADELEETVRELRSGNRSLEDKIARYLIDACDVIVTVIDDVRT